MSKTDPSAEIAYGALVRTDHVNATGNGKIATFRFQLRTDLTAADSAVVLSVPFYVAVLANSDTVRFNLTDGSAAVHVLSTGIYENNAAADFNSYPNPYSDHTTIHYTTGHSAMVTVEIYDMTGQRVATLFNGKQDGGKHSLDFAAGKAGLDVGMYLVKLTVDGKTQLKRIIETR